MAPPPWQALNCSFCPPSTVRLPVLCLPLWPCSSYSLLGVSGFHPAHSLGISRCFKWKKTQLNIGIAYPGGWCLNAWLLLLASDTLKMLGGLFMILVVVVIHGLHFMQLLYLFLLA